MSTPTAAELKADLDNLRAAYSRLISGGQPQRVEFGSSKVGGNPSRVMVYHPADLPRLEAEIKRLEALLSGQPRPRIVRFSTSKGLT
jgi:hypothetical protein